MMNNRISPLISFCIVFFLVVPCIANQCVEDLLVQFPVSLNEHGLNKSQELLLDKVLKEAPCQGDFILRGITMGDTSRENFQHRLQNITDFLRKRYGLEHIEIEIKSSTGNGKGIRSSTTIVQIIQLRKLPDLDNLRIKAGHTYSMFSYILHAQDNTIADRRRIFVTVPGDMTYFHQQQICATITLPTAQFSVETDCGISDEWHYFRPGDEVMLYLFDEGSCNSERECSGFVALDDPPISECNLSRTRNSCEASFGPVVYPIGANWDPPPMTLECYITFDSPYIQGILYPGGADWVALPLIPLYNSSPVTMEVGTYDPFDAQLSYTFNGGAELLLCDAGECHWGSAFLISEPGFHAVTAYAQTAGVWNYMGVDIPQFTKRRTAIYYVNEAPYQFNLISPQNGVQLTTHAPTFSWQQAFDPDNGRYSGVDDFEDGDFTQHWTWSVLSGTWSIVNDTGDAVLIGDNDTISEIETSLLIGTDFCLSAEFKPPFYSSGTSTVRSSLRLEVSTDTYYEVLYDSVAIEDNLQFRRVVEGSEMLVDTITLDLEDGEFHQILIAGKLYLDRDRLQFTVSIDGTQIFLDEDQVLNRFEQLRLKQDISGDPQPGSAWDDFVWVETGINQPLTYDLIVSDNPSYVDHQVISGLRNTSFTLSSSTEFNLLVSDDFEDGNITDNPSWTTMTGSWSIETLWDDAIVRGAAATNSALSLDVNLSNDFTIMYNYYPPSYPDISYRSDFFSVVRLSSGTSWYEIRYNHLRETIALRLSPGNSLDRAFLSLSDDQSYQVKWQRNPMGGMRVWVDGTLVLETSDTIINGDFDTLTLLSSSDCEDYPDPTLCGAADFPGTGWDDIRVYSGLESAFELLPNGTYYWKVIVRDHPSAWQLAMDNVGLEASSLQIDWNFSVDDTSLTPTATPTPTITTTPTRTPTPTMTPILQAVLVVDDDGNQTLEDYYTEALDNLQILHNVWNVQLHGSPPFSELEKHEIVIWFTGSEWQDTLTSEDQTNLSQYLDDGGKLFLTGQDIGFDLEGVSFYNSYLRAEYLSDDTNGTNLTGIEAFSDRNVTISGGDGANNQEFPSQIEAISGAMNCWEYSPGVYGGVQYVDDSTHYCLLYFAWGYEAINSQQDRDIIMEDVFDYLHTCPNFPTPTPTVTPTHTPLPCNVFFEDWESDNIDLDVWTTWGAPEPVILFGSYDGWRSLFPNGSWPCFSGVISEAYYILEQNMTIEWEAMNQGVNQSYHDFGVGIVKKPLTSGCVGEGYEYLVSMLYGSNHITCDVMDETWQMAFDSTGWNSYKFVVNFDGTVSFFLNDAHIYTSIDTIDFQYYNYQKVAVYGIGRSSSPYLVTMDKLNISTCPAATPTMTPTPSVTPVK